MRAQDGNIEKSPEWARVQTSISLPKTGVWSDKQKLKQVFFSRMIMGRVDALGTKLAQTHKSNRIVWASLKSETGIS